MASDGPPAIGNEVGGSVGGDALLWRSAIALGTVLVVLLVVRLFWGVDMSDESFYYAIAHRFLLGDRPFVDEVDIHLTASLLVTPFLYVHRVVMGTLEGAVLYMRFVYLGAAFVASVAVYRSLRRLGAPSLPSTAFLALLCAFHVPAGLSALNYDNITSLSLTIVLFSIFPGSGPVATTTSRLALAGAILAYGLIAYPTLVLLAPLVCFLVWKAEVSRKRPSKAFWAFLGCLALPYLLFASYIVSLGIPAVLHNLGPNFDHGLHAGGSRKLALVALGFIASFPAPLVTLPYLVISAACFRRFGRKLPALSLLVVPTLFIPLFGTDFSAGWALMRHESYFGLLGPYLSVFAPREDLLTPRIVRRIWVPGFVAALITAWTSSNGYMNLSVGLFPAVVATTWILVRVVETAPSLSERGARWLSALVPASLVLVFLGYNYGFVYGDGDIRGLSARIDRGPFKGLITRPEKKRFIVALEASIRAFGGQDRVLFYDYFPGGYLMTDARPASNTVWQRPEWLSGRRIHILEYLRKPAHLPGMVVRMKSVPDFVGTWLPTRYAPDDSLDRWVLARYTPREETTWYTVLLPNR